MIAHCGWDPTAVVANVTIRLDGNGSRIALLPSLYVTDVSAVVVTDPYGTDQVLTVGRGATDVSWSENGVLKLKSCWPLACFPEDQQNVAVTYSGGYSEVPDEITAVLESIGRRSATLGIKSRQMSKAKFEYFPGGELLTVEQMVLDRYRIAQAR